MKAHVILGKEAEDFVDSELGKAVIEMAKQDLLAAAQDLAVVNATDTQKIVALQVQMMTARRFEQYLIELITRGREEFETYKQQQEGQ